MILNLKRYISLLLVLMLLIGIVPKVYAAELPTDSTIPEETVSETVETTAPTAPTDPTDPTEPTGPPDETTEPTAETEPVADTPMLMTAADDYGIMTAASTQSGVLLFDYADNTLCGTGIRYDADKPWNKNMVARILQDRRYTGEGDFPQIIDDSIFLQVNQKRNKKVSGSRVTKAQKILKKKSSGRVTPHLEHEVLYLLNADADIRHATGCKS